MSQRTKLALVGLGLIGFGALTLSLTAGRALNWKEGTITIRTCRAFTVTKPGRKMFDPPQTERRHDMAGALQIPTGNKFPYSGENLFGECPEIGSALEASYDPEDPRKSIAGSYGNAVLIGASICVLGAGLAAVALMRPRVAS